MLNKAPPSKKALPLTIGLPMANSTAYPAVIHNTASF